jgi:hypothetical protein
MAKLMLIALLLVSYFIVNAAVSASFGAKGAIACLLGVPFLFVVPLEGQRLFVALGGHLAHPHTFFGIVSGAGMFLAPLWVVIGFPGAATGMAIRAFIKARRPL